MRKNSHVLCARLVGGLLTAMMIWVVSASTGVAQFGLPKLPKIPKVTKKTTKPAEPATPEVGPSAGGTAEIVATMSPDAAPPGGRGQVVITGKDFKPGMNVYFECPGAQFKADSVKVESPTKAVAQIKVPVTAEEGPCGTSMRSATAGKQPFRISNSASMPVALTAALLGEGDMQFPELMMKMSQAMRPGFGSQGEGGHIELAPGTIKYVQGDKTVFSESASAVKDMGEMKQGGQPIGIFRIVFTDGKIYNFSGSGGSGHSEDPHSVFEFLKKRLGK